MKKRKHTLEEIIRKLRQGGSAIGSGEADSICVSGFVHIRGDMLQVAEVVWGDEHKLGEASEEAGG